MEPSCPQAPVRAVLRATKRLFVLGFSTTGGGHERLTAVLVERLKAERLEGAAWTEWTCFFGVIFWVITRLREEQGRSRACKIDFFTGRTSGLLVVWDFFLYPIRCHCWYQVQHRGWNHVLSVFVLLGMG